MRSLKFLVILIFLVGSVFAGVTVPSWNVSQTNFRAGSTGVITMTVTNPGSYDLNTISMTILDPPELTASGPTTIVDLPSGGSTSVSIPFKVIQDAKSGIYSIEIRFTGYEEGATSSTLTTNSVAVPITVLEAPVFSFSTDTTLVSGITPMVLTIDNNGGVASNVRLKINKSSDVALFGTNELFVKKVSGPVSVDMTLDSRDADDGPVDIPLDLIYEDELGISHQETQYIRLTVKGDRLDLTFLQTRDLVTRREGNLELRVSNNGAKNLEDARIVFQNSSMRLKYENEIKLGDLNSGQNTDISEVVFADYSPGLNLVPVTMKWIEENVEREQTVNIPLTISSDSTVGVYLEAKPAPLVMGSEHTVSVLVSNLGSYGIDNVEVSIVSPVMQMLDISTNRYIGNLENDDFSTVQFKVRVNATTSGTYPLSIKIQYRDKSGEWKDKIVERDLEVYPVTQAGPDFGLYIILLLIVAGGVWYFKFRKKG